jgi:prepilin-type N-terminal cleavage/methylation domain-containing protein
MKTEKYIAGLNQKGFTLIELIAIMIIMGVLGSVAVTKYEGLSHTATDQVLAVAVKELNVRETQMESGTGHRRRDTLLRNPIIRAGPDTFE